MIDPNDFPRVEEAFCNISINKQAQSEALYAELKETNRLLKSTSLSEMEGLLTPQECEQLYENTQRLQKQRRSIYSALDALAKMTDPNDDPQIVEHRKEEFERICMLPQVINAHAYPSGEVSIVLHASYVYGNIPYFLGDWAVRFGDASKRDPFEVVLARMGRRHDWERGSYPDYTLPGPTDEFCLGDNTDIVTSHFRNFRFYQGVQLVAFLVCSINKNDESFVPKAFWPEAYYQEGGELWPHLTIGTKKSILLERAGLGRMFYRS